MAGEELIWRLQRLPVEHVLGPDDETGAPPYVFYPLHSVADPLSAPWPMPTYQPPPISYVFGWRY